MVWVDNCTIGVPAAQSPFKKKAVKIHSFSDAVIVLSACLIIISYLTRLV